MLRFFAAVGVLLLVLLVGVVAYAGFGFYDVAATSRHFDVVRWALGMTVHRSVDRHSADEVKQVPELDDPAKAEAGGRLYVEEGCIACHGGPGAPRAAFADNLRPHPPDLAKSVSHMSDAELFWVIKHGIRMTAMPAFGPQDEDSRIWEMVAFVRRMPDFSAADFDALAGSHAPEGPGYVVEKSGSKENGESSPSQ